MLRGEALEQLAQLRDYLVRRVRDEEQETLALVKAEAPEIVKAAAGRAAGEPGGGKADSAAERADRLRSLIVKTAKDSRERDALLREDLGAVSREMRQRYLAKSEFGEYRLEIAAQIEATARQIVESYALLEQITATRAELGEMGEEFAAYTTQIQGQIRRGFLEDPDSHQTVLGIAIAQNLLFTGRELTDGGWTYFELSPGQTLGLYTSTGWQFWVNGRKLGWFSSADGMLHTVRQVVEEEVRLGDWSLRHVGGFGIKYVG
jgi:hypothetical protein